MSEFTDRELAALFVVGGGWKDAREQAVYRDAHEVVAGVGKRVMLAELKRRLEIEIKREEEAARLAQCNRANI